MAQGSMGMGLISRSKQARPSGCKSLQVSCKSLVSEGLALPRLQGLSRRPWEAAADWAFR